MNSQFHGHICILSFIALSRKRDDKNDQKDCWCLQQKYLRDVVPLAPALKSWLANKLLTWRKVQEHVGLGKETKISNFQLNSLFPS